MEKLPKILLTFCLFVAELIYSYCVVLGLQRFGIDITTYSITTKYQIIIGIDLSFMFVLFLLYRKTLLKDITLYFKNFIKNISIGAKYWAIGLCIMMLSNIIISYFFPGGSANEEAVQNVIKQVPIYMIFSTIIYAPFVEELIFRKSIRDIIENDYLYVIISGLAFGFVHTLAGSTLHELVYIIPYGALGSCFALMYVKTKNVYTSMTFHMIHNAIVVFISIAGNILGS